MNYRYFGTLRDGSIGPSQNNLWWRYDTDAQQGAWVANDGSWHADSGFTLDQILRMRGTVEATDRFVVIPDYLRVSEGL